MPVPGTPDVTLGPYRQRNTVTLRATISDDACPPGAIPGSLLDSATLTLYTEHGAQAIINGRDHVDITADVDEQGLLILRLDPADMDIVDEGRAFEYHRALIEWTWTPPEETGAPEQYGSSEIRLVVRNVRRVGAGDAPLNVALGENLRGAA